MNTILRFLLHFFFLLLTFVLFLCKQTGSINVPEEYSKIFITKHINTKNIFCLLFLSFFFTYNVTKNVLQITFWINKQNAATQIVKVLISEREKQKKTVTVTIHYDHSRPSCSVWLVYNEAGSCCVLQAAAYQR